MDVTMNTEWTLQPGTLNRNILRVLPKDAHAVSSVLVSDGKVEGLRSTFNPCVCDRRGAARRGEGPQEIQRPKRAKARSIPRLN